LYFLRFTNRAESPEGGNAAVNPKQLTIKLSENEKQNEKILYLVHPHSFGDPCHFYLLEILLHLQ